MTESTASTTLPEAVDRMPLVTVGALRRALGCTPTEARALAAIYADRVAAQLQPELDALREAEQRRTEQHARQAARDAAVVAATYPSGADDRLVVASGSSTARTLGSIQLHTSRTSHWLTAEQAAAALAAGRAGEGWAIYHRVQRHSRELLICAERSFDLRAMLTAAFADDETHGERRPFECEGDADRIDDLVTAIVRETDHGPTLEEWHGGAALERDRNEIAYRLQELRQQRGALRGGG